MNYGEPVKEIKSVIPKMICQECVKVSVCKHVGAMEYSTEMVEKIKEDTQSPVDFNIVCHEFYGRRQER